MKIVNNTDTELVVTVLDAISFRRIPAGTFAYVDEPFDTFVISCRDGHVDVVKTRERDDRIQLYPHEGLFARCEVDLESNDFVISVFRVTSANKRSNSWFKQQDQILHEKSIRDASDHLPNAHITAFKRIDELTDAIKRSIQICVPNETTSDVKQIRNWAKEIMFQCNIIDSIDEN